MIKKVRISTTLFNEWITEGYNTLGSEYRISKGIKKDDILINIELSFDGKEIILWYDNEKPIDLMIEATKLTIYIPKGGFDE